MTKLNVYEIKPGRYAYGTQGHQALAIVERITAGRGRPKYRGVRGVRPIIDKAKGHKRVWVSRLVRAELDRVAKFN